MIHRKDDPSAKEIAEMTAWETASLILMIWDRFDAALKAIRKHMSQARAEGRSLTPEERQQIHDETVAEIDKYFEELEKAAGEGD